MPTLLSPHLSYILQWFERAKSASFQQINKQLNSGTIVFLSSRVVQTNAWWRFILNINIWPQVKVTWVHILAQAGHPRVLCDHCGRGFWGIHQLLLLIYMEISGKSGFPVGNGRKERGDVAYQSMRLDKTRTMRPHPCPWLYSVVNC